MPDYSNAAYNLRLDLLNLDLARELRALGALGETVRAIMPNVGSTGSSLSSAFLHLPCCLFSISRMFASLSGDDTPCHPDLYTHVNQTLLQKIQGGDKGSGGAWWIDYTRSFGLKLRENASFYADEIQAGSFELTVNAQGSSYNDSTWLSQHMPGAYVKYGQAGHD